MNQPTIIRDPELAAVLAELQRARDSLIRIEELLMKPIQSSPIREARNWGWWWQR